MILILRSPNIFPERNNISDRSGENKSFIYLIFNILWSIVVLPCCMGFPGGSVGKESTCKARDAGRRGFDPQVWKIPWRRAWHPTPVSLPGESPWTEEPGGLKLIGWQRVGHNRVSTHPVVLVSGV